MLINAQLELLVSRSDLIVREIGRWLNLGMIDAVAERGVDCGRWTVIRDTMDGERGSMSN